MLSPEDKPREHMSKQDAVVAALTGELIVDIEGHTMAVQVGDSIFIPLGIVVLLSVSGKKPVLTTSATKSW